MSITVQLKCDGKYCWKTGVSQRDHDGWFSIRKEFSADADCFSVQITRFHPRELLPETDKHACSLQCATQVGEGLLQEVDGVVAWENKIIEKAPEPAAVRARPEPLDEVAF